MKKILMLAAFLGAFSLGSAAAQTCSGSSMSSSKAGCSKAGASCCANKMAAAAKADPTIEARLDPSGSTYYVRKESGDNGTVRLVDVKYDEPTGKFVNVAPGQMSANAAPANTGGLVKKEASCTQEKKACCMGGGAGKCCAKKEAVKE